MKKLLAILALVSLPVMAEQSPVDVSIHSYEPEPGYVMCSPTWQYDPVTFAWALWRKPSLCYKALLNKRNKHDAFAAMDLSQNAVLRVTFATPSTTITVRQVMGIDNDPYNKLGDVEVSQDGETWVASDPSLWTKPGYEKPLSANIFCPWRGYCIQKSSVKWSVTFAEPATVYYVRAVIRSPLPGVEWRPSIAGVTAQ